MTTIFTTGDGSTFNSALPCRSSLPCFQPNIELSYNPIIHLTGKHNDHVLANGEVVSEVEAFDQYGEGGFIQTDFIWQ
jgi:hypothetical protein